MGNISDALRRAQQEREALRRQRRAEEALPKPRETDAVSPREPAVALAVAPPPAVRPAAGSAPAPPPDAPPNDLPAIDLDTISPAYVAWHDRGAAVSEQYRSLRTRIMNLNEPKASMVIGITSSMTGEGKTTSTMNVGITFAELQHLRVMVVDADLRRCSLSRSVGCDESEGAAEVLRGRRTLNEVLRLTSATNLHILPAGHIGEQNAAELLGSHASADFIAELRRRYDYVFVDLPPANAVADASILGALCDGALLVVRMHRTPEPNVKHSQRLLESSNVRLLGTVLVGMKHWKAPWLHDYGYGYGYDYPGSYSGYYRK